MIVTKILRTFWLFLCWGTLSAVVLAAVVAVAALYQVNTRIRGYVLAELQKRFPELVVSIGPVTLHETKGIAISDLQFSVQDAAGHAPRPLVFVEELFLECPVTIQALYNQELRIQKAVLRNPIIRLSRSAEGQFSELRRLIPVREGPSRVMPIEVLGGTLLYDDVAVASSQAEPLKISGISMSVTPPQNNAAWTFSGSASAELFRKLAFEGSWEPERKHWEFYANCRQLDWSAEFFELISRPLSTKITENQRKTLQAFQGRFDWGLSAVEDATTPLGCRFALEGVLTQGAVALADLDRTLSEMHGRFRVTDDSVTVEKLSGLGESARITLSYAQSGLMERRNARLSASIDGLEFDEPFVKVLHPFLNQKTIDLLAKFEYAGKTDLDTVLTFQRNGQGGVWKPNFLSLELSDLSFSFLEFPYKVERMAGTFSVDAAAELTFNLATKPGEPLQAQVQGRYENVFVDPVGQVRIIGENVPINARLMNALPQNHREVVATLNPAGVINADLVIKKNADGLPLGKIFEIGLDHISVEFEKFPYPLQKICGVLRLDDDAWTFDDVVGSNGSALVRCGGHLKPVAGFENVNELFIKIAATELPLDEQLAQAIPDQHQRELLASFQVNGKANIAAEVKFVTGWPQIDLRFQAIPCPAFSLQPGKFPYRLDEVQGQINYENGLISAKSLKAKNRKTEISTDLECRFTPDGRWMLTLNPLTIDQLNPDRELLDALPAGLRGLNEHLKIDQPLNLHGAIGFSKGSGDQPVVSVWDVGLILHQNSANFGFPIDHIFGELRLAGYGVGEAFRLAGDLHIDSALLKGYPVTKLEGPFFYDGMTVNGVERKRLYIGQTVGQKLVPPPQEMPMPDILRRSPWFTGTHIARPLRGQFFEGTLFAEGLVIFENYTSYSVKTQLVGADLARIAQHLEPSTQKIAGTLNSRIDLFSSGKTLGSLGGQGTIQLRDANIYEAPGMIRLLRELSIRETDPEAGTFSAADIDFRLIGPQMRLDQLTFEGGAFLLKGNGVVHLDTRQMNLLMQTRLGNKRWQIPGVSDLIGGVGDQLVQLNVHGPISDPTVARVLAPEAQKFLRAIQGEEDFSTPAHAPQQGSTGVLQLNNRPF